MHDDPPKRLSEGQFAIHRQPDEIATKKDTECVSACSDPDLGHARENSPGC